VSGIAILVFEVAADLHGHESAATLNLLRGSVRQIWTTPAFRLNAAARLTIASHGVPSDTKQSPTTAPTRTSQDQSADT
jgi:hypothetical protein